jgi:hypothetical protein
MERGTLENEKVFSIASVVGYVDFPAASPVLGIISPSAPAEKISALLASIASWAVIGG